MYGGGGDEEFLVDFAMLISCRIDVCFCKDNTANNLRLHQIRSAITAYH